MITTTPNHKTLQAETDFLVGVKQACNRQSFFAADGLNTSVDSEGGFLVPPSFAERLSSRMYATGEILRRCDFIDPLTSNEVLSPTIDESSRADGSRHGGVQSYWGVEAAELTDSTPTFAMQRRKLNRLVVYTYSTDELVDDYPGQFANTFERLAAAEANYKYERGIVRGSGIGQPLGLLNADCKIAVDGLAGQGNTIYGINVVEMFARLWGPSQRKAVWLYNQNALPQLSNLVFEAGYGSGSGFAQVGQAMWNWDGSPTSGGWPTLMGRPAIPCEHCSTLGTEGDLILTDLSQYGVSDRTKFDYSMHIRFIYSEGAYRFTLRADGAPLWASTLTPENSTTTLSPIVTLATRT